MTEDVFQVDEQEPHQQEQPPKLKVKDFAAKIKIKYPQYKDINDEELTKKIVEKYPEYKNQIDFTVEKKNGLQPSATPLQNTSPQSNESVDIISMEGKPISEEPQDVVSLALKAKTLSNKKISATTGGAGAMMGGTEATYEAPDVEANKEGEKIKFDLKKMGFDADKLANDFDGIPDYVFESFPKEQLLSDYTNNPEKYSRTIGAIKGQIKMGEAIDKEFKNQNIDEAQYDADKHDFINSINLINNAQSTAERTRHIRRVMEMVDRYGGDNKEDIKKNLATDFAYVYGKMAGEEDFIMSNAGSNLNNNQAAALEYVKDVHPEQLKMYAPAFVNKDLVKDNYEAQLAQEESLKRLDELGIQLSRSYLKEKLAPIKKEYDQLSYEAQTDGMTPELQQRLVQLEQEGAPVYNKLQMLDADQQNLSANYPKAAFYEANTFAQELIGQKHGFFNHALSKVGEASKNTVEGVWDFATSPLKSNEEEQLRQAEVVGEGIKGRSATYVTDISGKPVLSPELKAEVEKIKNDNNLSYDQKLKATTQLLMQKNGEWYKEPESNVNLKSLAYGITDLAAGLVPFMGLEMLTGGGATAGLVRKFTSTFVSAAATSFEDAYRSGIEKGVQNPYAYATRVTAINSAAIAGAGTPDKIRAMFAKSKSAIGDLVAKMSDKEIEATLKEMPKALKGFKVSLDAAKSKLVSSGKSVASSFGDAAKINTMMTAGNIANDAISGELRSPADYTKDFLVETLKFGLLSTGTKAATKLIRPTDMGMAAIYEAATNKDGMILHVDEKVKQGDISPTEGEQLKKNIEDVSKIYKKNAAVIGILFDKQKREYLYNALTQERSKRIAESLPEKEGEKYEIDSEAAKFRNGLLVEPKTESQLEKRKEQLEKSLVPEKDESGKNIEIPRKEVIAAKAEMKAIDDVLAEYAKAKESNVTIETPLEKSGVTEIGEDAAIQKAKEGGVVVEKPMQPAEVATIGEEVGVNIEKAKDLINSGVVKGYTAEILKDVANNDPVQFKQYLKEIADQAQDPLSEKATIDTYGKELVDVAKKMFPKEIENETSKEPIEATEPILTKEEPKAEGVVTEVSEGAEVPKEKVGVLPENQEVISITHAATNEVAKELGLPEYEKNPETIEQWDAEVNKRLAENPNAIQEMMDKYRRGEKIDKYDQRMMLKYHAALKDRINKNPTPENIKQYNEAKRLSDIEGGREVAKSLVARKGIIPVEDNLANFLVQEANSLGVETLPQKTIDELKAKYEADQKVIAELNGRIEKLEKEAADRALSDEAKKIAKAKRPNKDFKAERQSLKDRLKKQVEDYKASFQKLGIADDGGYERFEITVDMAKTIGEYVKSYLEEGVTKLDDIVSKLIEEVKDVMPDLSERDVRDVIAGKYAEKKKTRNEIAIQMRDLKMQQLAIDKIKKLERGESIEKNAVKKQKISEELSALRGKIQDFESKRKDAEKALENAKKEDEALTREFEREVDVNKKKELAAKIKTAKELNAQLNKKTPEEIALQSYKTGLKNKIAKLKADLESGDFLKEPEPKKPLKLDEEAKKLLDEHIRFVKETNLRRAKAEFEQRGRGEKAYDTFMQIAGLKRIVQTAVDLSIPFRQGVTIAFNPRRWATFGKSFSAMMQSVFSPKNFDRMMYAIHQSPDYQNMLKDKVHFNEMDAVDSNSRNEEFQKSFVYKIPIIREPLLTSNRAADGFLNTARFDMYMKGKKMLEKQGITRDNSPESYEALGKWVMNTTGRGNMLKFLEDSHAGRMIASNTFFGARLMASRFNLLNPLYYAKMPKEVRVEAMKDMGSYVAMIMATALAANAAGAKVSVNPDDADFLKLKTGNTRYDISGGMVQYVRTFLRLEKMLAQRIDPTVSKKEKDKYAKYAMGSTVNFFQYKLAPNTAYALSALKGKDALGRPFDPMDALKIYPMYVDDMITAYKQDGMTSLLTVGLPSILGVGVQTYEDKKKR